MGSTWSWIWATWILAALFSFLAIELTAIVTHRMDRTLSENLRRWLGIYPVKPWRKLGGVLFASVLGTGVTVLIWHIVTV